MLSGAHPLGDFPPGSSDGERRSRTGQRRDESAGFEYLSDQFRAQVGLPRNDGASLDDQIGVAGRAARSDQIDTESHVGRVGVGHRELVDDALAVGRSVLGSLSVFSLLGRDDVFDGDCHVRRCC